MLLDRIEQITWRSTMSFTRSAGMGTLWTSGCWIKSIPASTEMRNGSGFVEWVSAINPRL